MTSAPRGGHAWRLAVWLPGLVVALGAAAATAHGLYEVALAARVPVAIAWLYPLITDGLALVAYAATTRLRGSAARYAWLVVVLAAGLSGLAQAAYLATGATVDVSPALRFGVGAWPAIAAAIVAHLLYLLAGGVHGRPPAAESPASERPSAPADTRPTLAPSGTAGDTPVPGHLRAGQPDAESPDAKPRDRARAAAQRHADRHSALPSVRDLAALAGVSRGTAAKALQDLRAQPVALHLIRSRPDLTPEEPNQR